MECNGLRYSRHAIERMFQRAVTPEAVAAIVARGDVIASYPDDVPYPSVLILGFDAREPVHIVVARNSDSGECTIITVYRPGSETWGDDFRSRRQS